MNRTIFHPVVPDADKAVQTWRQAGPRMYILAGGDAVAWHNNRIDNLREQIIWMGLEDPWRDPAVVLPRNVIYQQNIELIEVERQRFVDFNDIPVHQLAIVDGDYEHLAVRLMWEGWLGARIGFKRGDY